MPSHPVAGTWHAADGSGAYLTFDGSDRVLGSDGCNPVNGTVARSGESLTFTLGFSTLMACPGVTVSFSRLAKAVVEGDQLHTFAVDGSAIVTLHRAG